MSKSHGLSQIPEYRLWIGMIQRCYYPKHKSFHNYGGRGITVCARWFCFAWFLEDVGRKPSPLLQLDRINNDGNYEPGNVRWATASQNRCNQRIPATPGGKPRVARSKRRYQFPLNEYQLDVYLQDID